MVPPSGTAALALASLTLSACHGPPNTASPANAAVSDGASAPPAADTVVGVEDDGKSFDVARGGTVTFKLASHAGTGYAWVPTQIDPAALAQQGDRTSEIGSETPGAPKLDVYRFVADGAGETGVEMSLRRSFGGGAVRVLHVTIRVK
jgi:predicted secreted protein